MGKSMTMIAFTVRSRTSCKVVQVSNTSKPLEIIAEVAVLKPSGEIASGMTRMEVDDGLLTQPQWRLHQIYPPNLPEFCASKVSSSFAFKSSSFDR